MSRKRGYTFVEITTVTLVMAVLAGVAVALFNSAVATAQRQGCRANMQTLVNALEQYRVHDPAHRYPDKGKKGKSILKEADLAAALVPAELPGLPRCPGGGSYVMDPPGDEQKLVLRCSIAAHGEFQAGVDSE